MAQRVGIVAVAQTKYAGSRNDLSPKELANEPVSKVLAETGLGWAEDGTGIDRSVIVCDDFWDGQTLAEVKYGDVVGAHMRDSTRVSQDGAQAVWYAASAILSGHVDIVLVLAACKESLVKSRNMITNLGFDPIYQRMLGMDNTIAAALQAKSYMQTYGIRREQCAQVVVKNRANARNNPFAQAPMELSIEDVLASEMLASPISVLDAYPVSDGACALIMANEEKAKRLTRKPVWINGLGCSRDTYNLGTRDITRCEALQSAANQAYHMAGITDPRKEVDLVELSEQYSYQELLWSEGLGLCGPGEGGGLLESGVTEMGGELPVNPSGGVISGIPTMVAGLSRVVEASIQLRGEAGARTVEDVGTAVAHGMFGPAGQLQTVVVLGT